MLAQDLVGYVFDTREDIFAALPSATLLFVVVVMMGRT
jgi:hypothetical protein